jgi:predicted ribosome-associated RNA-binding protein Tma20
MDEQITQEKYQGMKTAGINRTLKTRRLRNLLMKKLYNQIMVHKPLRYRERRQHQYQRHKKNKHLILLQDQMMHLNSKYLLLPSPVRRTIKFYTIAMR